MKHAKVKIEGLTYIDCVGAVKAEEFMRDVCLGHYGEAEIVDFHVTRDTETLEYGEQNILIRIMHHLYNTRQTHGAFCKTCDTWLFGRGEHIFRSPCDDHDRITMTITGTYEDDEVIDKLRKLKDAFARYTEGEHRLHIYTADTYFSTAENLALLELQYPESEHDVWQMVEIIRKLCPELSFIIREPTNCFVEVKRKIRD